MLSYASEFRITDEDMKTRELMEEGRVRVIEMTQAAGYMPAGETEWKVIELWDGLHLLGVTPVQAIIRPKPRARRAR